ncbi:MAG: class I SAM-dependent rRNA methyltransferase [Anaerolineae bacterium]|jgi:23S rRNA (cytosine1962-C5)-methyltransferase
MSSIILKRSRARPVLQRHPWIFSGAIQRVEDTPPDGSIVDVHDAGRNWLARGYINRQSQITVRLLTWHEDEPINRGFWRRRLQRAITARHKLGLGPISRPGLGEVSARRLGESSRPSPTTAYRLVHAESDYLPGLIVDRYDQWLVVQFLTLGMDKHRGEIVELLADLLAPRGIYERSDVDVREQEGLEQRTGLLWGEDPPPQAEILENHRRFLVNVREGQKTGFYLDQRENREQLSAFCSGAEVLDAFAYTGAFAVYAATGRASSITLVDSSAPSLEAARQNLALNPMRSTRTPDSATAEEEHHSRLSSPHLECVEGDVFSVLRGFRAENQLFDVIILDPPKLASTRRQVERASRAYKDVNLLAFQLLRPGGVLFTFSCSGRVSADLFQKIVFGAVADAGRQAQIIGRMAQGPDHPVALTFPEGSYLKGLICRVW